MTMIYNGDMTFDVPTWDTRGDGWTEDCGRKMDFDPTVVSLNSRAYADGDYIASVYVGENEVFSTGVMHAASQQAAMAAIEEWSAEHVAKIASAIRALYALPAPPSPSGGES